MKLSDLNINPDEKMLREFGLFSLFGFGIMGLVSALKWELWQLSFGLWGLAVFSFLFSFIQPKVLRPLFVLLMVVAFPVGFVISNVILALLFYAVFTPLALFFKIIGRDALNRKIDPNAASYWVVRDEEMPVSQRFKQY
ncbi:SxtJ family membrane protein [Akkermansiaceae bacterium]|jgi:hypothetical protein|nr:SxtJ family membrane protein [Akkermansiaceae bacterium]|tara:strand:- start:15 stop:431 length:417 start_codon:yes stop_codon:yes gene_type:complete